MLVLLVALLAPSLATEDVTELGPLGLDDLTAPQPPYVEEVDNASSTKIPSTHPLSPPTLPPEPSTYPPSSSTYSSSSTNHPLVPSTFPPKPFKHPPIQSTHLNPRPSTHPLISSTYLGKDSTQEPNTSTHSPTLSSTHPHPWLSSSPPESSTFSPSHSVVTHSTLTPLPTISISTKKSTFSRPSKKPLKRPSTPLLSTPLPSTHPPAIYFPSIHPPSSSLPSTYPPSTSHPTTHPPNVTRIFAIRPNMKRPSFFQSSSNPLKSSTLQLSTISSTNRPPYIVPLTILPSEKKYNSSTHPLQGASVSTNKIHFISTIIASSTTTPPTNFSSSITHSTTIPKPAHYITHSTLPIPSTTHHTTSPSPIHHTTSPSSTHHTTSPSPIHYTTSQSPIHHTTTSSLIHHITTPSPIHHITTPSPIHHTTTQSPIHHTTTPSPIHHITTPSPIHHTTSPSPFQHTTISSPTHQKIPPNNQTPNSCHASPPQYKEIRLPQTLKPIHYEVKLQPYVNLNASMPGLVEVEVEVLRPTKNITFHTADILYQYIKIETADKKTRVKYSSLVLMPKDQLGVIHLQSHLKPPRRYLLTFTFTARLNREAVGVFESSYTNAEGKKTGVAATLLQPSDARRVFPCFDEPAMKATFDLHVARTTDLTTLANMPLVDTRTVPGFSGWAVDRFAPSIPMAPYQLAFAVAHFTHLNCSYHRDMLIRVWGRPEVIHKAEFARDLVSPLMAWFEGHLGIPYPLPKLDLVALPASTLPSAFEAWGLILNYDEDAILYSPHEYPESHARQVGTLLAHELAHQWFGNLVTPAWWTHLWLSEGFATYYSYKALHHVDGSGEVWLRFLVTEQHHVMRYDDHLANPVRRPAYDHTHRYDLFDRVVYQKGASVLKMLESFLSPAVFRKGVVNYLTAFTHSNAVSDDLWHHLQSAAEGALPEGVSVKGVMDGWTLQRSYPVVTVERSEDGSSAVVTQKPYRSWHEAQNGSASGCRWWVPITYTTKGMTNSTHAKSPLWLSDTDQPLLVTSLPPSDQWVVFNVDTGYYRVNYDEASWRLIIAQLREDHHVIRPTNRAQILDDAVNLAIAGELSFDLVLDLIDAMTNETELLVAEALIANLDYINLMLAHTPAEAPFADFLRSILGPIYELLGVDPEILGSFNGKHEAYPALVSWACLLGVQDCVQRAQGMYGSLMHDPKSVRVPSMLRSTVYCTAIEHGGFDEWQFAVAAFHRAHTHAERSLLLNALACTRDATARDALMGMMLSEGSRLENTHSVFNTLHAHPAPNDPPWALLERHWKHLNATVSGEPRLALLKSATRRIKTEHEQMEVSSFLKDQLGASWRGLSDAVLSEPRDNTAWLNAHYHNIYSWLQGHGWT